MIPEIEKMSIGGGYGISWSPILNGYYSVCEKNNLHIVDIQKNITQTIPNLHDSINDVCWNYESPLILSVGEDSKAIIVDERILKSSIEITNIHDGDGNSCSFDPINTNIFITGGGIDGFINFWDMRYTKRSLYQLGGSKKGINCCQLSSVNPGFVSSASKDHKVRIYDMQRVAEDQNSTDKEDGGSELLIVHSGHLNEVYDSLFHYEIPHVIGSCGEGYDIQIWKPVDSVVKDDITTILQPDFLVE